MATRCCSPPAFRCGATISRATSPTMFKVTYEDAECLKQEYGCALLGLTADSTPDRSALARRPRLRGSPPQRAERNSGSARRGVVPVCARRTAARRHGAHLFEGIVLTGGGALLNGMCDMAERVLELPGGQRLATEDDIGGWPEELKSPLWTTAAGLAMYSAKLKLHRPPRRQRRADLMGLVLR